MSTIHDLPNFTGRQVIDEHGEQLGSIDDVLFDPHDQSPEFLVVKPGALRKAHYVPVEGAYESVTGAIVVPWDHHWVKQSPTVGRSHVLSASDRSDVEAHYAHR